MKMASSRILLVWPLLMAALSSIKPSAVAADPPPNVVAWSLATGDIVPSPDDWTNIVSDSVGESKVFGLTSEGRVRE